MSDTEVKKALSVSQLNKMVADGFKYNPSLHNLLIQGEISNFAVNKGHFYFTLKDEKAAIRAVMWCWQQSVLHGWKPKNGEKVVIEGDVKLYEAGGIYQIECKSIKPKGIGDLAAEFELLKQKLTKEGLFRDIYKKPIPELPNSVGVVTASTGAAIQDIQNVYLNRYPCINVYLYSVKVQGEGASDEIVKGIEYFNNVQPVDVIIVGRGGGSIEDLWAFNEEKTVRAIFASKIPVVSGTGHEVDHTLTDYVADAYGCTPTAAATKVFPDRNHLAQLIDDLSNKMLSLIEARITSEEKAIYALRCKVSETGADSIISNHEKEILKLTTAMENAVNRMQEKAETHIDKYNKVIEQCGPERILHQYELTLNNLINKCETGLEINKNQYSSQVEYYCGKINTYDPQKDIKLYSQMLDELSASAYRAVETKYLEHSQELNSIMQKAVLENPTMLTQNSEHELAKILSQLEGLNPFKVLNRGYSMLNCNNKVVTSVDDINVNDILKCQLADGEVTALVTGTKRKGVK